MADHKVELVAAVNADQAKQGFQEVKTAAADMAQSVAKSGETAGAGVDAIGDAGERSAQRVDKSLSSITSAIRRATSEQERALAAMESGGDKTSGYFGALANIRGVDASSLDPLIKKLSDLQSQFSVATAAEKNWAETSAFEKKAAEAAALVRASDYVQFWERELQKAEEAERRLATQTGFVNSLRDQASAIGKTRSELLEMKAAQLGVAEQAAPFIAQLRAQEAAFTGTGISAGQMKAALRGVPAQFTDIVTSLASGQSAMTVFMQQGGQLKDMFGGAGVAARALGSYVLGLINPFSILAAAAGTVALAYYQGSREADALTRAIIMTGNAAGATTGQLQDMAKAIASATGATQAAANDAVTAVVASGKVASANVELVASAATKLERAIGQPIKTTIDAFVELGKEPVKASEKLNEQYHYLTASVYAQIKALEDQGKAQQAADLAQKTFAEAMAKRADDVTANLGTLEKAWRSVTSSAKGAWDAMLGVGREASLSDQIAQQKKFIAGLQDGSEVGNIDIATKRLATLQALADAKDKDAKAQAASNVQVDASIALAKEADKYLTKEEQKRREIAKLQQIYSDAVKGGTRSTAEITAETKKYEAALAGIEEKFKEREARGRQGKSQDQKDAEQLAHVMASIYGKTDGVDTTYFSNLDKLFAAYGKGKLTLDQYKDAVEKMTLSQKFAKDIAEKSMQPVLEYNKILEEQSKAREQAVAAIETEAIRVQEQADLYGLTKTQVAQLTLARAEDRLEQARAVWASDETISALEREVEARKKILEATSRVEVLDANKKAAEQAAQEWQKVADDVGRALTDSIFQGGKNGWEQLKKTIEATIIRATVQPYVTNMVGGVLQAVGLMSPSVSTSAASGASSLLSAGSTVSTISKIPSALGLTGLSSSFSGGFTAALNGGTGLALEGAGTMISEATSLTGALQGVAQGLGAVAPYLTVAMLAASALGAFNGPTYHHGGAYMTDTLGNSTKATAANMGGFDLTWGAYNSDRTQAYDDAMKSLSSGIAQQIASSVKALGGDASKMTVASRFASDNSDYSVGALRIMNQAGKVIFDLDKHYTAEAQKGMQEFAADSTRALVAALKASNLGDVFDALFATVDPLTSSIDDLNAALTKANTISNVFSLTSQSAADAASKANMSIYGQFQDMADQLRSLAQTGAFSLDSIVAGLQQRYSLEVQLIQQINDVMKTTSQGFQDSIRGVKLDVLDTAGKYNFLDAEAQKYKDIIASLSDPTLISDYANKLKGSIDSAWGLLSADQKAATADQFIARYNEADKLVTERLQATKQAAADEQTKLVADIREAVKQGYLDAAAAVSAAVPKSVDVNVWATPGLAVSAEATYDNTAG